MCGGLAGGSYERPETRGVDEAHPVQIHNDMTARDRHRGQALAQQGYRGDVDLAGDRGDHATLSATRPDRQP